MNNENAQRPITAADVEEWRACIGREKVQQANADSEVLRRFALAAGINPDVEKSAPLLSHWALFVDAVADEKIGADGHPKRGDFLPSVFLPRRMFAAAAMTFHAPLQLGAKTDMVSTITSVEHKAGRSGDLVFVKVQREVSQQSRHLLTEEQTIVYRPAGDPLAPIEATAVAQLGGEIWTPEPVHLFRFSAMTYNSHRIHYDLPYTTAEEGYPGLVVHGPFTALKLLDYACRNESSRDPKCQARTFSFRGIAPLFVSQPIALNRAEEAGKYTATRCDGSLAMAADVRFD